MIPLLLFKKKLKTTDNWLSEKWPIQLANQLVSVRSILTDELGFEKGRRKIRDKIVNRGPNRKLHLSVYENEKSHV